MRPPAPKQQEGSMSRNSKGRTVLLAGCVFAVGWIAGATYDRLPLPSFLGSAVAQTERTPLEYNLLALMLGVASVAVDTEAAALRINELTDRLAAVERRVQQLETPARK
jgi:hypothetical protein